NSTEHNRQNREDRDNPSRSCGVDLGTPPAGLCVPEVGSRPRSRSIPCSARTPHVGPDLSMAKIPTWAWNTLYGPRREAHGASISLPRGHLPPRSSPQWYSGSASAPFHRAQRSRGQEVRSPSPPVRSRFGRLGRYAYAPCHVRREAARSVTLPCSPEDKSIAMTSARYLVSEAAISHTYQGTFSVPWAMIILLVQTGKHLSPFTLHCVKSRALACRSLPRASFSASRCEKDGLGKSQG